jgi:hypothetical protein
MDEEKQSEPSGEELEQLGPYLLHEQVQLSHDGQVERYVATHETSEATALVRKHAGEGAKGLEWHLGTRAPGKRKRPQVPENLGPFISGGGGNRTREQGDGKP